jgi:hypothetical protein
MEVHANVEKANQTAKPNQGYEFARRKAFHSLRLLWNSSLQAPLAHVGHAEKLQVC